MTRPFRILILEDEEMWRNDLAQRLSAPDRLIQTAANPAQAWELLAQGLYHLLLLDFNMSPGDHADDQGLLFLHKLRETRLTEALRVVIVSAYGTLANQRAALVELGATDFVDKHHFDGVQFVQLVDHVLKTSTGVNPGLTIHWQDLPNADEAVVNLRLGGERIRRDSPARQRLGIELDDLLCRLFHDCESIVVQPMQRGRSGAGVLRVQPFYHAAGEGRPQVVKFGEIDTIRQEVQNFQKFVRPFLGGGRSTSLEGTQRTPLLQGISYSLLGAVGDEFEDFGSFYRRASPGQVRGVLDNLFSNTCAAWYAAAEGPHPHDLSAEYLELLGMSPEGLEEALQKRLKAVQGKDDLHFDGLTVRRTFRNPIRAIAARNIVLSVYACATHGDLNASNILVDRAGSTWLIDFLRTGRGHILRDFAQLDVTTRILLLEPDDATLDERLEMEQTLLEAERFSDVESLDGLLRTSNLPLAKSFATAVHLRRLAAAQARRNPRADMAEYYTASLYYALNTIRFWNLPPLQREHALLSAALLAERLRI